MREQILDLKRKEGENIKMSTKNKKESVANFRQLFKRELP
jgi:hypothetical protein